MADDAVSRRKPADHVSELKELVVGYARQETVDPLKTLGRYLGFGVSGALAIGLGVVMFLMALLRAMQAWGPMDGDTGAWSLVPYAVTIVVAILIVVMAGIRITKEPQKGSRP